MLKKLKAEGVVNGFFQDLETMAVHNGLLLDTHGAFVAAAAAA